MGKGRAPCCDKNQVKRGPWSPAEDLRLITFIQNHGHDNWRALPKQAGLLRCGKSCRLRWINYLRPDVKRGNFTQDEEEIIIKLHKTWGNKWSKIASRLPGRTDNEIKNVWNTHLKKRLLPMTKVSDSSGDEPKESPTTSSSSSFSLLSSNQNENLNQTEPLNKTNSINNNLFCSKQQTTSSLSTNTSNSNSSNSNSNSSSQVDTFWPQNHFDFGDQEVNKKKENEQMELELELESPSNNMEIEIPLESDTEFWDMLDLDNIDLFESNEVDQNFCEGSNFVAEKNRELFENDKWFKYLENELGLDRSPEADTTAAERLLEDVDPCVAYFADGFTRQL